MGLLRFTHMHDIDYHLMSVILEMKLMVLLMQELEKSCSPFIYRRVLGLLCILSRYVTPIL